MLGPERASPERMQAITDVSGSAFVAAEGDIVVGGIYRSNALLQGLVVDPRYRGRGYGRRLVEAAERALQSEGYEEAELIVDQEKKAERRWYEKMGYRKGFVGVGMVKNLSTPEEPPGPETETLSPYQAFQEIYSRHLGAALFLKHPATMQRLLEEAPFPALRSVRLGRKLGEHIVASATVQYAYQNAAGVTYFRRWADIPTAQSPRLLLRAYDTFTETHRSFGRPAGHYVCGDPANQSLTVLTVDENEERIILADPLEADALLQSLRDGLPVFRDHTETLRKTYRRSRRLG